MASVQEPGTLILIVTTPKGNQKEVARFRVDYVGQGGSPDGVIQNSQEKWPFLPRSGGSDGKALYAGCELQVHFIADGADGIDISDCAWVIPISVVQQSGIEVINLGCNATDMDAYLTSDYTTVAALQTKIAAHRAPTGRVWYIGGGPIFMSMEDDTA